MGLKVAARSERIRAFLSWKAIEINDESPHARLACSKKATVMSPGLRIILALVAAIGGGMLTVAVLATAGIHGLFVTSTCIIIPIVIFRLVAKPPVS